MFSLQPGEFSFSSYGFTHPNQIQNPNSLTHSLPLLAFSDANTNRSSEAMLNNGSGTRSRRGRYGGTPSRPRPNDIAPRRFSVTLTSLILNPPRRVFPSQKLRVLSTPSVQST